MLFEHADWKDFQALPTLGRKAGVPQDKLAMVVAKELADNALDAAGAAAVGLLDGNGFYVADEGDGIAGDDRAIASLFSVDRPLRSSKQLRLPMRGALGNGLRVVAGAVFASAGGLIVSTSGRTLRLIPRESGATTAERIGTYEGRGTRVEVRLGPPLRVDDRTLAWAREALALARGGQRYRGKPSPHWFDSDTFYLLLRDAGEATVRQVIAEFDGCSEPKAGKIAAPFGKGRPAREFGRDEAERLLKSARALARPVKAGRLGQIGPGAGKAGPYKLKRGAFTLMPVKGKLGASIPYVVEAWAEAADGDEPAVRVSINRTPVTADVESYHDAKERTLTVFGCGLKHAFKVGREPIDVRINVETPYMPITSDGKEPDLTRFRGALGEVLKSVGHAARRHASHLRTGVEDSQEAIVLAHLDRAIDKVSGGGRTRYSLRQLYYALRPHLIEAQGDEPSYKTFSGIITRIENRRGQDLPGIYRDSRGTLYHPHTGEPIPLGTLNVERYRRPEWTFNKILYCEKEGFFPILIADRWAERHDCALLTSKGFATRAARDVLDLLGDADKALQFFCIHDADAYGTRIYQALRKGTQARPERTVEIVNLGLEPEEALAMGLQVEAVNRKSKRLAPVGDYVEDPWRDWLQEHRVELNAMDTPRFLAWLARKFAPHAGKVIPPAGFLRDRLIDAVKDIHWKTITDEILRRADVEGQVERAYRTAESALLDRVPGIGDEIAHHLRDHPADLWSEPLRRIAREIAGGDDVIPAAGPAPREGQGTAFEPSPAISQ
jgi:Topoisomerase 6 subunit A/Spo11, Toprim domain